jgi:O-antigen/teichoic acid export membrane protein
VFQANEKMEYQSIGSILNIAITLSGVLLAISFHMSIIYIAVVYLVANIVLLMFHFTICAWKFLLPKKIEFDRGLTKFLILEALPLTISGAFLLIAFRIDTVILSLLTNNSEVGIYNAAYNLLVALLFLPSVYVMAIFPVLSRLYVNSKKTLQFSYERSFKYMALIGLPIAVGTTLLANPIILIIYKSTFYQSIIALQILIWAIPLLFVDNILGVCITSINKQRETIKITFLAMVVNIVLNFIFIRWYGFIAASVITVLTELICFIFWFRILDKHGYKVSIPKMFFKPAIASAIMGLLIVLVKLNLFLEIILGTLIYFGVLILLKTFTEEDINLLNQLIDIDIFKKILKINKK